MRAQVEVFVLFDVAPIEVGNAFGGAEGDVDEKRLGVFFSDVRDKLAKFVGNFRIFRENLFEVRVGSTIGLHDVEDDLVNAEVAQEAIDVEQVGQVAIGEDGGGVQFDAEAFELRDGLEAGDGLFETVGGPRQTLVEFFRVAVDGDVKPVHARFGEARGVRQVGQTAAVGHDADLRIAERFGHADEIGQFGTRGGFARREANFGSSATLFQDPADPIDGHGGIVDVAAVAIFFHAEDAVVVADGADRDVNAFVAGFETFGDGRCDTGKTFGHESLDVHGRADGACRQPGVQIWRGGAELA